MILAKAILFLEQVILKCKVKYLKSLIESNAKSCGKGLRVNGVSYVNDETYLGENVSFNGMRIGGRGKVTIGDNFHSGTNCQMITQNHNYNTGTAIPYDSTYIAKDIIIEDNVWLGNDVIILGGVRIGEGVIIQAGSVVVKDVPKYAIAGGHPCTVFSQRDVTHYEKLKSEGKFH